MKSKKKTVSAAERFYDEGRTVALADKSNNCPYALNTLGEKWWHRGYDSGLYRLKSQQHYELLLKEREEHTKRPREMVATYTQMYENAYQAGRKAYTPGMKRTPPLGGPAEAVWWTRGYESVSTEHSLKDLYNRFNDYRTASALQPENPIRTETRELTPAEFTTLAGLAFTSPFVLTSEEIQAARVRVAAEMKRRGLL